MGHVRSDALVASALAASDAGVPDAEIAERHGVAVKTVRRWRRLYKNWATRVVAGAMKRYEYPRWEFVNRSDDILGLCTWALDLSAIAWRRPRINAIAVSRRDDVRRLDAMIGPKT